MLRKYMTNKLLLIISKAENKIKVLRLFAVTCRKLFLKMYLNWSKVFIVTLKAL